MNFSELNGYEMNGYASEVRVIQSSDAFSLFDTEAMRRLFDVRVGDAATLIDLIANSEGGGSTTYTRTATDALALPDDLLHSTYRNGTLADNAILLDASIRTALRNRITEDPLAFVDGLIATAIRNRTATDGLALIDAISRMLFRAIMLTDTVNLFDEVTKFRLRTQQVTDSVTPTDDTLKVRHYSRQADSNVTLADNLLRVLLLTRLAEDSLTPTDSATATLFGGSVIFKTASDALAVSDSGRTIDWYVYATDLASVIDGVQIAAADGQTYTRMASDSLTPADTQLHSTYRNRALSDALNLTDGQLHSVMGSIISRTATDGIVVTDTGRTIYWSVMRSEGLVPLDSYDAAVTQPYVVSRRMTEALTVGDQEIFVLSRYRFQGDVIPMYDSVGHMPREIVVRATDEQAIYDAFSKFVTNNSNILTRTATDAVILTDVGRTFHWYVTRSDYVAVAEQLLYTAGEENAIFRTVSDVIQFTDSVFKVLLRTRAMGDSITLYDAQQWGMYRDIWIDAADDFAPSDGSVRTAYLRRNLMDAIVLADNLLQLTQASTYTRTLSDSIEVQDQAIHLQLMIRLAQDTIRVIDEEITQVFAAGNIYSVLRNDSLALTDSAIRSAYRGRIATDDVTLMDDAIRQRLLNRGPFDSVTVQDNVIMVRWNRRTLSELLNITDSLLPVFLPFLPFVFYTNMKLGMGEPPAVLAAEYNIELVVSDQALLGAQVPQPLGQHRFIYFGGYS